MSARTVRRYVPEVALADYDQAIQTLLFDRPDEPLGVGVAGAPVPEPPHATPIRIRAAYATSRLTLEVSAQLCPRALPVKVT